MAKKNSNVIVFPTLYKFNGRTKRISKLIDSPATASAYSGLLKELGCKPWEVSEALRHRAWKGKSARDIMVEADSD